MTHYARPRHKTITDVILCRERDKFSRWIIWAQRLVRRARKVHYTHVGLHLNGCVLHAVPGTGVDVEDEVSFFMSPDLDPDWRVFRHRVVDSLETVYEDSVESREWFAAAERISGFYLTQGYNWKFGLPKPNLWRRSHAYVDPASFCSELVAKIFLVLKLKTDFEHRRPAWVFPADIARAVEGSTQWLEVTDIYRDWLARLVSYPDAIEGEREFQKLSTARFRNMTLAIGMHAELLIEDAAFVEGTKTVFKRFGLAMLRDRTNKLSREDKLSKAIQDVLGPSGGIDLNFDAVVKDLGGLRWTTERTVIRARKVLARVTRHGPH